MFKIGSVVSNINDSNSTWGSGGGNKGSHTTSTITFTKPTTSARASGNPRPQLFQLAEPLWTDPGLKSEIGARDPIATFKIA